VLINLTFFTIVLLINGWEVTYKMILNGIIEFDLNAGIYEVVRTYPDPEIENSAQYYLDLVKVDYPKLSNYFMYDSFQIRNLSQEKYLRFKFTDPVLDAEVLLEDSLDNYAQNDNPLGATIYQTRSIENLEPNVKVFIVYEQSRQIIKDSSLIKYIAVLYSKSDKSETFNNMSDE